MLSGVTGRTMAVPSSSCWTDHSPASVSIASSMILPGAPSAGGQCELASHQSRKPWATAESSGSGNRPSDGRSPSRSATARLSASESTDVSAGRSSRGRGPMSSSQSRKCTKCSAGIETSWSSSPLR